ncbi:WLM-domain-containing protein [Thermothelomyces heterothallicus CBS 203.75]
MEPTEPIEPAGPNEQQHPLSASDSSSPATDEATVEITIKFPPEKHNQKWVFSPADTFEHLIMSLSVEFPSYDWSKAKALPEKRRPGLKSVYTPADDPDVALSALDSTTLRLLAPQTSALSTLQAQREAAAAWQAKRALARARARARYARPASASASAAAAQRVRTIEDASYTFHTLRPLPHLPNPGRSLAFLERLRDDPGVRAAMRKHRFSVGLLTEMDPASHTAASQGGGVARVLGLNRNRGEVIELRLRTDAYDGYRDYRTIRKTLCHELAHNVHGDHDADFWALCREIERDVDRADWKHGGRTVGPDEYAPERPDGFGGEGEEEEGTVVDHGGWEGGTYVLGGGGGGGGTEGLSAREIRARAAEARHVSPDLVVPRPPSELTVIVD